MTFIYFYDFPYIGNNDPSWLIFFRGVETTNQVILGPTCISKNLPIQPSSSRCVAAVRTTRAVRNCAHWKPRQSPWRCADHLAGKFEEFRTKVDGKSHIYRCFSHKSPSSFPVSHVWWHHFCDSWFLHIPIITGDVRAPGFVGMTCHDMIYIYIHIRIHIA